MVGLKTPKSMLPDKHFYLSIGASLGSGLSYYPNANKNRFKKESKLLRYFSKKDHGWHLYFPFLIFFISLWGLVPDIIHASGIFSKEVTRSAFFNIFFLHSYLEYVEDAYPLIDRILNWHGELILFAIAIGFMIYYVKIIKRAAMNHQQSSSNPK